MFSHCLGGPFLQVLQLYQISVLSHGLMMVGPSGSGKSTAWRVLMRALERLEGIEGVVHVIEPKVSSLEVGGGGREVGMYNPLCCCCCCGCVQAITKEELYGVLDPNTREWTDGLFTHILRK